jgi:hypothetical protein
MSLDESRGGPTMPDAKAATQAASTDAGASARASDLPSPPPPPAAPKGLIGQVGETRGAAIRLVQAHVNLAKAEFSEILGEVKRLAIAVGVAFALLFFAGLLLPIGGALFLGEWLFGSLGWGVLLGVEFAVALAIVLVLAVVGGTRGQVGTMFLIALVVGVIVGVVFGLDLTNQGWTRLADNVNGALDPGVRPLVTAVEFMAAAFAIVGLLFGLRAAGLGGAIGGLIGGAIVGAILGAFTAIRWGPQAGAAAGIAIGLIVWPALFAASVMRRGIDMDAMKKKFYPDETIETTRETIEWVRKQTPLGRKS